MGLPPTTARLGPGRVAVDPGVGRGGAGRPAAAAGPAASSRGPGWAPRRSGSTTLSDRASGVRRCSAARPSWSRGSAVGTVRSVDAPCADGTAAGTRPGDGGCGPGGSAGAGIGGRRPAASAGDPDRGQGAVGVAHPPRQQPLRALGQRPARRSGRSSGRPTGAGPRSGRTAAGPGRRSARTSSGRRAARRGCTARWSGRTRPRPRGRPDRRSPTASGPRCASRPPRPAPATNGAIERPSHWSGTASPSHSSTVGITSTCSV